MGQTIDTNLLSNATYEGLDGEHITKESSDYEVPVRHLKNDDKDDDLVKINNIIDKFKHKY